MPTATEEEEEREKEQGRGEGEGRRFVSGSGYRGDSWGVGRIEEAVKRAPTVDHAQHVKQGSLGESTAGNDDINASKTVAQQER